MNFFKLLILLLLITSSASFAQKKQPIDGIYKMKKGANSAFIQVQDLQNGTIKIEGEATWVGNADAGQVNMDAIAGVFKDDKRSIMYYEQFAENPKEVCKMQMYFIDDKLVVVPKSDFCGGYGTTFEGTYSRTKEPIKKWEYFNSKFSEYVNPVGGEFGDFWAKLQKSILSNKPQQIADLIEFPLLGAEGLVETEVSKDVFIKNYSKIFPSYSVKAFKNSSKPVINSTFNPTPILYKVTNDELPEIVSNVIDNNSTVYRLVVGNGDNYVGFGYYFAKIDGVYKLAYIQLIG